jgi:16S rRNA processing protein RimM
MTNNYIPMGHIIGAFGIKGWLKVKVSTTDPMALDKYKQLYIKNNNEYVTLTIEKSSLHNGLFQVKFHGIDDRTIAELYKNNVVYVLRSELPKTDTNEYYWADLINMQVINQDNVILGKVISLLETGPTSVLVIKGDEDYMIPFVSLYIETVDFEQNSIKVYWGLDY